VFPSTKIRLFHSDQHLGAIRNRAAAAMLASGEVIAILDSHMEAQEKWYGLHFIITHDCMHAYHQPNNIPLLIQFL
jgi:hypothetical protein